MPYADPKDNYPSHAKYRGEPGSQRRVAYNQKVQARRKQLRSEAALAEVAAQNHRREQEELGKKYGWTGRINVERR